MIENTSPSPDTLTTSATPLLDALRSLLVAHRPAFRQERTFLRAQALILGHLFAFAKRTITQSLLALGLIGYDWSAFYRLFDEPRIDYEALTRCFLRQTLPHVAVSEPYVVAVVDGVQLPRSSHKMPGTSWLKSPRTTLWPQAHAQTGLLASLGGPRGGRWVEVALPGRGIALVGVAAVGG